MYGEIPNEIPCGIPRRLPGKIPREIPGGISCVMTGRISGGIFTSKMSGVLKEHALEALVELPIICRIISLYCII